MDTSGSETRAAHPDATAAGGRIRQPQGAWPGRHAKPLDFAAVVIQYETPLLRYVRQLFGNDGEAAEEIVQEAFLRLHRQIEQHGAGSIDNLSSWLFRVAHNLTISTLRRRELERKLREQIARDAAPDRPDAPETTDALDDMVRREMCDLVMAELRRLPDEQKQVLLLKVIQGFTLREIGEITDQALSNVSYRVNQGLRELARRLKSQGMV